REGTRGRGGREPHVERRDQALPAGEDLRSRPLDQVERLRQRLRLGIGERRRFQIAPPRRRLCMIWTTLFPRVSWEGTLDATLATARCDRVGTHSQQLARARPA